MTRIVVAWPLAVVFLLAMTAGCSPPGQDAKPAPPSNSAWKEVEAAKSIAEPKGQELPSAEVEQPAAAPADEPLPQSGQESLDLSTERFEEPPPEVPDAKHEQEEPSEEEPRLVNPLRDLGDLPPLPERVVEEKAIGAPATETQAENKPAARPRTSKNSGIPFDPIKENGPIFVGWPKPKAALIITGMESGYLEPCGCAGLDRMKGGMARRYSLFQDLRKKGWPVVGLDVGGLVHDFGRQAELKYQTIVEGKRKMGYDAIAFGADDLRLPAGELVAVAAGVDGKPSPFVAANVGLFGFDAAITPKSTVVEAGGLKIGVTAVLGAEYQKEIHNDEIEMADPAAALEKIVPELKDKADVLVLLSHATREESESYAKRFPEFNIVVTSDGYPEPPATAETIPGTKTLFITVGQKGMSAVVLGLYEDAGLAVRYQRVPLDSRFATAPEMKMLMGVYQEQLKAIGFSGLGLRSVAHPLLERNGRFVGSEKCETCHEKSYDIWKKSGHSRAYKTLVDLDPPRNFDPECVSCHVVGWHPTKYFPYESGYESETKTPHLINTGCEDCHGPGEKHVAAESGGNTALQEELRKAMVVTKAESKKQQCASCHDIDNSPDFDFEKYWPFVEHYEKND